GRPTRPGVNGGLLRRMAPGQTPVNYIGVERLGGFVRKAERLGGEGCTPKTPGGGVGWVGPVPETQGHGFPVWEGGSAAAERSARRASGAGPRLARTRVPHSGVTPRGSGAVDSAARLVLQSAVRPAPRSRTPSAAGARTGCSTTRTSRKEPAVRQRTR